MANILAGLGSNALQLILLLFPVTSKVRDYNCQNSNYITVTDPRNAALLRY